MIYWKMKKGGKFSKMFFFYVIENFNILLRRLNFILMKDKCNKQFLNLLGLERLDFN